MLFALLAAFVPLKEIVQLVNIGTLFAFVVVNIGVIILRRTKPDLPRGYKVPFVPWFPIIGTLLCVYLMADLPGTTWVRFFIWMGLGPDHLLRLRAHPLAPAQGRGRQPRGRAALLVVVSAAPARARTPRESVEQGGTCSRSTIVAALIALGFLMPPLAEAADELSTSNRLDDRRFVTSGPRAYEVGTEAGRYPAMGFHTRGEMGGVWTPPIKLVDGIWFGVGKRWIGPATRFTSGYGHVRMRLPGRGGLSIERTDFVPGEARGVLVGLRLQGRGRRTVKLRMQTHSELMSIYPWGETDPYDQTTFNLPDQAGVAGRSLLFTEQGTPPADNAEAHDWAAAVGSRRRPARARTGAAFRGPQDPPLVCNASGPGTDPTPETPTKDCDDTEYGKGKGGELTYKLKLPRSGRTTVWFGVAGSENGAGGARRELARMLDRPGAALRAKIREREALQRHTQLELPGDPLLARGIDWSKQNLADSVQEARDLEIREVNAGKNYPPAKGTLDRARFVGAGFPDYPWLFATDGEFTAFASVALGQFEPIKEHLRALRRRLADHQRRQRQGRPRGDHRRLGVLRRQRRRRQHRRDRQVPERRRADLALDGRRRVPRRDVRLREVEPRVHLPRARRRQGRLARGPRQRRARGDGPGEARQHDRDDARAARPRGPREVQGRHRHGHVGGRARPPTSRRASRPSGGCPRSRSTPTRSARPTTRSSSATGSASRRWRSRPCATAGSCRA